MDLGRSSSRSPLGRGRPRRRASHVLTPQLDRAAARENRCRRRARMDGNSSTGCFAPICNYKSSISPCLFSYMHNHFFQTLCLYNLLNHQLAHNQLLPIPNPVNISHYHPPWWIWNFTLLIYFLHLQLHHPTNKTLLTNWKTLMHPTPHMLPLIPLPIEHLTIAVRSIFSLYHHSAIYSFLSLNLLCFYVF